MMKLFKAKISLLIIIILLASSLFTVFTESASVTSQASGTDATNYKSLDPQNNYASYARSYSTSEIAYDIIPLDNASLSEDSAKPENFETRTNVVKLDESTTAEWTMSVKKPGLYNLEIDYFPLKGNMRDIEFRFEIDGDCPFFEAEHITLLRVWADNGAVKRDNNNNDIRAEQVEKPQWLTSIVHDNNGLSDKDFLFYLSAGTHKIRITPTMESLAISGIRFGDNVKLPAYAEIGQSYEKAGYKPLEGNIYVNIPAENPYLKSRSSIYSVADFSSPSTVPSSPNKIRINMLGGLNWRYPAEWVSWKFDIVQDGLYTVNFKYRQDLVRGIKVHRDIYIDGKIPCKEMLAVSFPFTNNWTNITLTADNEPIQIYLNKGEHEIRMDVALGEISQTLQILNDVVYQLNEAYRKIITITGTTPDTFRDYNLDTDIPGMMETFKTVKNSLNEEAKHLEKINGQKGGEASLFYEIAKQLNDFLKKPDTIPKRLSIYKSNISALASLILRLKEQPLELDYLVISSVDYKLPKADLGLFQTVLYKVKAFWGSFFENYNAVGNTYEEGQFETKPINVWVSANDLNTSGVASGRDQMQILKTMIDTIFVPDTSIPVNLNLVDSSATLTQAILAGQGPDVALIVPDSTPVNLAMRGALADLSKLKGFDETTAWFYDSAFVPYRYYGGVYGLPETQNYFMQFYRTDIFNELGIKPPETWDDFYKLIPKLQKKNLEIGMINDITMYEVLLFQKGGNLYKEDWSATDIDTPEGIDAFEQWTDFFAKYSFPLYYDGFNRFRTGEMPLIFSSYTFFNYLAVAAPEISNLWAMVPIPGTMRNGVLDTRQASWGTGCIMLKSAKNKDAAFEFMKWWVNENSQARFGTEIESLLGPSARYNTANINAFKKLPWSNSEQKLLMTQWQNVSAVPNVPGNYYVYRMLTNAFRRVVFFFDNPRDTLLRYNDEINIEIARKREEFGLK